MACKEMNNIFGYCPKKKVYASVAVCMKCKDNPDAIKLVQKKVISNKKLGEY